MDGVTLQAWNLGFAGEKNLKDLQNGFNKHGLAMKGWNLGLASKSCFLKDLHN